MTIRIGRAAAFLAVVFFAAPAHAHHAMDGEMPSTFFQGFVSGLTHPVIGVDHLAFIVAAGLIAAVMRMSLAAPIAFVVASLAGVVIHLGAIDLPAVELLIAISVVCAGGALALARTGKNTALWLAAFSVAGVFHGYAFGESIVGAEQAPLIAYLTGLAVIQSALAVGIAALASNRAWLPADLQPRLAGAAAFGVGVTALVGNLAG